MEPVKKRFIYVGVIGELPYTEVTLPRLEAYAEACGAQLILTKQTYRPSPKLVFFDLLAQIASLPYYSEAVIMDADLLVLKHDLNVFDYLPTEHSVFGQGLNHISGGGYRKWVPESMGEGPWINTGLVGIRPVLANYLLPYIPWDTEGNKSDQIIFNSVLNLRDIRVRYFPKALINFTMKEDPCIFHPNAPNKLELIENILSSQEGD